MHPDATVRYSPEPYPIQCAENLLQKRESLRRLTRQGQSRAFRCYRAPYHLASLMCQRFSFAHESLISQVRHLPVLPSPVMAEFTPVAATSIGLCLVVVILQRMYRLQYKAELVESTHTYSEISGHLKHNYVTVLLMTVWSAGYVLLSLVFKAICRLHSAGTVAWVDGPAQP